MAALGSGPSKESQKFLSGESIPLIKKELGYSCTYRRFIWATMVRKPS
jgi:hypothetical protein